MVQASQTYIYYSQTIVIQSSVPHNLYNISSMHIEETNVEQNFNSNMSLYLVSLISHGCLPFAVSVSADQFPHYDYEP